MTPFVIGKKYGKSKEWYENGGKKSQTLFNNDEVEYIRMWHKNGKLKHEASYSYYGDTIFEKHWNSKGEEVDPINEAN